MSKLPYRLSVCPKRLIDDYQNQALTHLLSLEDPGTPKATPRWFKGVHRQFHFHDVESIQEAKALHAVAPSEVHVTSILDFGKECLGASHGTSVHLLVHCFAGVSRSTAACYALAAQVLGQGQTAAALHIVLKLQPEAFPNSLIVRHADKLLGFRGELVSTLGPLRREFSQAVDGWLRHQHR